MKPLRLSLSGFLSYRELQTLDFTSFDIACISGTNGAGKSSLLDAITWVMFGKARKTDDSLVNTASDKAEVTLDFEYEDQTYRIHRSLAKGKTGELEFSISKGQDAAGHHEWRTLTERRKTDTQDIISRTLHLDYDTFVNASFFLQGKADLFAQQKPSERKRILASILGLDVWESYLQQARKERALEELKSQGLDTELEGILAELAEEDDRKKTLTDCEAQLKELSARREAQDKALQVLRKKETQLNALKDTHKLLENQLGNLKQTRAQLSATLQQREEEWKTHQDLVARKVQITQAYADWQSLRKRLETQEELAKQFREIDAKRHAPDKEIEAERARLNQALSNLADSLSTLEKEEARLASLNAELDSAEQAQAQAQKQIEQRQALEEEMTTLNQQLSDAKAASESLKTDKKELHERLTQLKSNDTAQCPLCGQDLTSTHRQELITQLSRDEMTLDAQVEKNADVISSLIKGFNEKQGLQVKLKKAEESLRAESRKADQSRDQIARIEKQRAEWNANLAPQLANLRTSLSNDDFLPEARQKLAEISAQLNELGYDAVTHQVLRQAEIDARNAEVDFVSLGNAQSALQPLERDIATQKLRLQQLDEEITNLNQAVIDSAARLAAEQAGLGDLKATETAFFDIQQAENQLRTQLGAAQQNVNVLTSLKKRKKDLAEERDALMRKIEDYKTLEKAFGKNGVPAQLIELALPEIENHANDTLARLSNGVMSIHLETQREYKDAKREDKMETLDILISDGASVRDYELYSGGEAFRVNFAIRLALARILALRANARLKTLVIDEGFGNQDAEGRQRLVEAINLVSDDFDKILVITHLEELKDFFPNRIEVEKTSKGSIISVF